MWLVFNVYWLLQPEEKAKLGEDGVPNKVYFAQKMRSNRYCQNNRSCFSRKLIHYGLVQLNCISFHIGVLEVLSAVKKWMYFSSSWEEWRVTCCKYF